MSISLNKHIYICNILWRIDKYFIRNTINYKIVTWITLDKNETKETNTCVCVKRHYSAVILLTVIEYI